MRELLARPFDPDDMVRILGNEVWIRRSAEARAKGPAYTMFCSHGEVAACAGVTVYWEGMGEVWVALTEHTRCDHRVDLVLWTRKILTLFERQYSLRRMQCDVLAADEGSLNFAKHFGFEVEGLMRRYDVLGRDYYRLARIKEA